MRYSYTQLDGVTVETANAAAFLALLGAGDGPVMVERVGDRIEFTELNMQPAAPVGVAGACLSLGH